MTERSVKVRLSADVAEGIRNVRQFGAETKKSMAEASKYAAEHGRALDDLGSTAGRAGAVAAAGLGLVGKAAMDWESDWAGVTKTVDGTAQEMAQLEGELRGLATTLPATHSEIAGVAEAAGQLGVAREDVSSFTKTMVDLGETTNLTAEDAATSIAQMANVMRTAPDEIDNLGASLVAVGNAGASTERQIIEMSQGISGAAAVVGLAEADVLGIANAVASIGIEVEAGGTSISRVLTSMAKSVADGGDMLEAFADTAGVSADDFARAFEERPAEAFTMFIEGLGRINAEGGNVFATLDRLGMEDVRVSRALLGMASDSDKFAGSLDLANQAWGENTALLEEAEKRYATTASQVQVAWNEIKDAGIEAGGVLLPMIADVAGFVGDLASEFGDLPGPVQTSAVALAGVTAVLGGGLWFTTKTISGINETRAALSDLGVTAGGTRRALAGIGLAAAAIYATNQAITKLEEVSRDSIPSVDALTNSLLNLGDAEVARRLASDLGDVGAALDRVTDPGLRARGFDWMHDAGKQMSALASGAEWLAGHMGGFGEEIALSSTEAEAAITALDQALANIASTGSPERAAEAFAQLAAAQNLSKAEQDALLKQLPQYADAIKAAENAASLAADGTDQMAGSTADLGAEAGGTADEIRDLVDAMRDQRSAAIDAANAEIGYQAALDDARASIADNGRTLDITTEKGRANKRALLDLAAAWNSQSAAAKDAPGAHKAAIDTFVRLARQMGMGKTEARELAQSLYEIPERRVVDVQTRGLAEAQRGVWDLTAAINSVPTHRVIQFRVDTLGQIPANYTGSRTYRASGGPVYGPGTATSDSIPAMLSNGEYVVRAAAVDRYGVEFFHAANQMRLAAGGLVGAGDRVGMAAGGSIDQRLEVLRLQQQINQLRHDLNATGKEALKPLARAIAEAELEAAKRDLRQARRAPVAERRAELREQRAGLRGIELDVEAGMSVEDTREALREFRRDVKEAGGTWTNAMARQAGRLIDLSKRYAATERSLEAEKARRDELDQTLQEQIRTLEDLQQTMDAFSSGVAKNFLSDPFNQSYTASGDIGGAPANLDDPALIAARDQLGAAEARLAEIRGRDMDPLQRSYLASRAVAEVAQLRDQVDQLERSTTAVSQMADATERTVSGLQAFEEALQADIDRLTRMDAATEALIAKGLDPLSDFYAQLVQSGDVDTAEQLAALTPEQVDYYEELYGRRGQLVAQYAAEQTELVFGARLEDANRLSEATRQALAASERTMARLENRLETVIPQRFEQAATKSIEALNPQIDRIVAAIAAVPREMTNTRRTGKGKGRA